MIFKREFHEWEKMAITNKLLQLFDLLLRRNRKKLNLREE
jgi:hypothetical protein